MCFNKVISEQACFELKMPNAITFYTSNFYRRNLPLNPARGKSKKSIHMKTVKKTKDQNFAQSSSSIPQSKTDATVEYGLKGHRSENLFFTTCPSSGVDIVINRENHEDQFGRSYTH